MTNGKNAFNALEIGEAPICELLRGYLVLPNEERSGLVILIEGKPGTGKSTLALQLLDWIDEVSRQRKRLLFSIEQSQIDVASKYHKMIAAKLIQLAPKTRASPGTGAGERSSDGEHAVVPRWHENLDKFLGARVVQDTSAQFGKLEEIFSKLKLSGALSRDPTFNELICELQKVLVGRLGIEDRDKSGAGSFLREKSRIEETLTGIIDKLDKRFEVDSARSARPLAVVDGLSLFQPTDRAAASFQRLVDVLRRTCAVGIMVYEPGSKERGFLEHQVDMMIELHERWMEKPQAYLLHELCIRKSRYQDAALGSHQYKIRDFGLEVFPSVHFQVHQPNYMALEYARSLLRVEPERSAEGRGDSERPLKSETQSIIDSICHIQAGDSTVLLGPRGSFKTELCLDFLCRGSWGHCKATGIKPDTGLLVSMIGNAHQTHGGLRCPFNAKGGRPESCKPKGNCCAVLPDHIYRFHQRPGFITPAEFLSLIKRRVLAADGDPIGRFVLWDLTQLDYRFPLFSQDTMLLTALIDFFKANKIKALFMGAGKGRHADAASAIEVDPILRTIRSGTQGGTGSRLRSVNIQMRSRRQ